jgi:hypothetical protein
MAIEVTCSCGSRISVEDRFAGKSGKCRKCGERLVIPSQGHEPAIVITRAIEFAPAVFPSDSEAQFIDVGTARRVTPPKARNSPLFVVQVGRGGIRYHRISPGSDATPALVEAEPSNLTNAIHSAAAKQGFSIAYLLVFCVSTIAAIAFAGSSWFACSVAAVIALVSIAYWPHAAWSDRQKQSVSIYYDLDDVGTAFQESSTSIAGALSRVGALWSVNSEIFTSDWKRNAGVNTLVTRQRAGASLSVPKCIITNVRAGMISVGTTRLFFFPDQILLQRPSSIESWQYSELLATSGTIRFVESDRLPHDAQVVDHTWQYVNKNGSPDRRFANNRRLPVALYGTLELGPVSSRQLSLQVSSAQAAAGAAKLIELVQRATLEIGSAPSLVLPPPSEIPELSPGLHPYSRLAETLVSGRSHARYLASLNWLKKLPDWAQPIAIGSVLGLPIVFVMLMAFGQGRAIPNAASINQSGTPAPPKTEVRSTARTVARTEIDPQIAEPKSERSSRIVPHAAGGEAKASIGTTVAGREDSPAMSPSFVPRLEARSTARVDVPGVRASSGTNPPSGPPTSGRTSSTSSFVDQSQSNTGYTPSGKALNVGPRGGIYHYSASGRKVYHSRKR